MFERKQNERIGKNSNDDGRAAVEKVCRVPHHESYGEVTESRKIDAPEESDRNPQQRRKQQKFCAAHDRVRHTPADFTDGCGKLGEEIPIDGRSAVVDEVTEDKEENANGHRSANSSQR